MTATKEPSKREQLLMGCDPIAGQLPIVFDTGARWNTLHTRCARCGTVLGPDRINGTVTRSISTLYTVEGMGWCDDCQIWTRLFVRLREDMTFEEIRDGRWVRYVTRRDKTILGQAKTLVRSIMRYTRSSRDK